MALASWYLCFSVLGLVFTWNAYRPRFAPSHLATVSFFAGWLTSELALHNVALQVAATALFASQGALARWPGWLGLALSLISWVLLVRCYLAAGKTRAVMAAAVAETDGAAAPPISLLALALPFPVISTRVARVRNLVYHQVGKRKLRLDVCGPRTRPTRAPTLLYVHGGAWVIGDKNTQGLPLVQHLAELGWVCFSIDYRLSPRATFPDHLLDVKRALAWIREHGAEHGADPDCIVIAGGSAGGHLAALAALTANDPEYQPGFERADTSVAGCIPFYGVYDLLDRGKHFRNPLLERILRRQVMKTPRDGEGAAAYHKASPLSRIHAAAPPFLVVHGELDTLVPVAEARGFVAALRAHNVECAYAELPGAQHAFEIFRSLRTMHMLHGVARFASRVHARHLASADRRAQPRPSRSDPAETAGAPACPDHRSSAVSPSAP